VEPGSAVAGASGSLLRPVNGEKCQHICVTAMRVANHLINKWKQSTIPRHQLRSTELRSPIKVGCTYKKSHSVSFIAVICYGRDAQEIDTSQQ
jgi:hypothetical protein